MKVSDVSVNSVTGAKIRTAIAMYWPCFLVLLAFIGFISKSLYNYPVAVMAILGLYKIIKNPGILSTDPILKYFTLIFLCLWLPLLISYPDAVNKDHSLHTVLPYTRFFFAGIFIIDAIAKNSERLKFVTTSIFYLVLIWCIDATIQFLFQKNLVGFPYTPGKVTGVFYPRNTIAHICSVLSPFFFMYLYLNNRKGLYITLLPLFLVILLSGSRASWIMMILSSTLFIIYVYFISDNRKKVIKNTCIIFTGISILLASTVIFHTPTNHRFNQTMGLFSNDYETIDTATSYRLPIWHTAFKIFKVNPVNGIGPRGFRHIYKDFAEPDDLHVKKEGGTTQPHLLILEIMTETGLIGLLGYIVSIYLILLVVRESGNQIDSVPFLIPVLVALFPLNAHMAFYGSIWSSMTWLLISVFFTCLKTGDPNRLALTQTGKIAP